ncbi:MAG: hypothetical protein M3235_18870 [Actinomycetota bacterium]|nr:hypothetical protein [Actinomycetota bacterium]
MREEDLRGRVGHRFPGGSARIEPYVDWLVRDMTGAPAPDRGAGAHPTVAFLAATEGLGVGLEEVFALFGSSSADGPMLGEWAVEFARPLRTGIVYDVTAEVEDARRRTGRSGTFDLATVKIELAGPDRATHATVRPTYVFPRRACAGSAR